jgi:hypothetical protein
MESAPTLDTYHRDVRAIAVLTRTIQPIAQRINAAMQQNSVQPLA